MHAHVSVCVSLHWGQVWTDDSRGEEPWLPPLLVDRVSEAAKWIEVVQAGLTNKQPPPSTTTADDLEKQTCLLSFPLMNKPPVMGPCKCVNSLRSVVTRQKVLSFHLNRFIQSVDYCISRLHVVKCQMCIAKRRHIGRKMLINFNTSQSNLSGVESFTLANHSNNRDQLSNLNEPFEIELERRLLAHNTLNSPTATRGLATPFTPTLRSARSSEDKTVSSRSSSTSFWGERNHRATRTITRDTAGPYFIQETLPPPSMAVLAKRRVDSEASRWLPVCSSQAKRSQSPPPFLLGNKCSFVSM